VAVFFEEQFFSCEGKLKEGRTGKSKTKIEKRIKRMEKPEHG
jgi:hypothetical protein